MAQNAWARTDRIMRAVHLYTGLFLVPWMMVYAVSAFFLNHGPTFTELFDVTPPEWKVVDRLEFAPDAAFPTDPEEQARAILEHLDLDGAHRIPKSPDGTMTILRISGGGHYRVTWRRSQGSLIVERQPLSFYRLIHFLHFKAGYGQKYFAHVVWAAVVDIVTVSIVIWVISGIYIWARRPRRRLPGGICLAAGILIFLGLVLVLCT